MMRIEPALKRQLVEMRIDWRPASLTTGVPSTFMTARPAELTLCDRPDQRVKKELIHRSATEVRRVTCRQAGAERFRPVQVVDETLRTSEGFESALRPKRRKDSGCQTYVRRVGIRVPIPAVKEGAALMAPRERPRLELGRRVDRQPPAAAALLRRVAVARLGAVGCRCGAAVAVVEEAVDGGARCSVDQR
jgi:hypothetical protein